MMSAKEIAAASAMLGNQLAAGIPLRMATSRMAKLQRDFAVEWQAVSDGVGSGQTLSSRMREIWPEDIISAIVGGETSGNLPEVLKRVREAMELKLRVRAEFLKIVYPLSMLVGGIAVFLFYMAVVIPSFTADSETKSGMLTFGNWISVQWMGALVVLAVLIAGAWMWIRIPENREVALEYLDEIPVLNDALRNLFFGQWAYQLAILDSAGTLAPREKLTLSAKTLPKYLRAGVDLMADEFLARGLADASDPDKQDADDPRRAWPFYIAQAFIMSHETGEWDKEFLRVAPHMVEEGFNNLNRVFKSVNFVIGIGAVLIITSSMFVYYFQAFSAMQKASLG